MLGYLKPNYKRMPEGCKKQYRSVYCGLCHCLKSHYGVLAPSCTNYEISSFLLLVLSLEREPHRIFHGSCAFSPMPVSYIDYMAMPVRTAAAISMFVFEKELADNLMDEPKMRWRLLHKVLRRGFSRSEKDLHTAIDDMSFAVDSYYAMERNKDADLEELLSACGNMISAICAPLITWFARGSEITLMRLTNALGRWIYMMDACDDHAEDVRQGRWNPLQDLQDISLVKKMIASIEEEIRECISRLPIQQFEELIAYLFADNLKYTSESVFAKYERENEK